MIPPSGTIAFWVVALVVFLIVEAVTAGLVSIWFVFGSLGNNILTKNHSLNRVKLHLAFFAAARYNTVIS